ncbi:MAG: alpha/beta hydrolase [Treponema sp.]|jgi:acetyl esterase/lipase|nr:alpha/beta hydrolase [Treponema sp.]
MTKKEIITVEVKEPVYFLDEEVTYAQADAWFGHVTRDLRMDIIYPQTEGCYPCVIWICGGAWMQMSKSAHLPYLTELSRRGFVVASVDYRLGHESPFPGALIDIKAAVRYLRAHAKRYSINTEKFAVMGESAGGYLAAMTALTDSDEFEAGEYLKHSSAVQAACCWYAPCDLVKLAKDNPFIIIPTFLNGDIKDDHYQRFINPIINITDKAPPFLLLHGTDDQLVPFEQSELFHEALIAKKIDTHLVGLKGEDHAGPQFFQQPVWDIIAEFFKDTLK